MTERRLLIVPLVAVLQAVGLGLPAWAGPEVIGWGGNRYHNGTNYVPMETPPGLSNVVRIVAGGEQVFAFLSGSERGGSPHLLNPQVTANSFQASLATDRGKTYIIERKNLLGDPTWSLALLIAGNGRTQALSYPISSAGQGYFRARCVP